MQHIYNKARNKLFLKEPSICLIILRRKRKKEKVVSRLGRDQMRREICDVTQEPSKILVD
jgi:hypothetical protein